MSQSDFGNLSSPLSGSTFINTHLEPFRDALHTMHSGTSRPSYAVAGLLWLDTTSTPWIVKQFDGTDDITWGTVNATTNTFTPVGNLVPYTAPTTTVGGSIALLEGTTNGTNTASVKAPDSLASNAVITLPSATGTLSTLAGTETLTNKKVTTQASTTTEAMLTVTPGVAPTTPNNGDVWVTSAGVFARVNGVTQQFAQTPWVAYTPTFTGFGTPTNVNFYSRRNGNDLEIRGAFTGGTSTAVEARITVGFNGTNAPAGLVADSAVITSSPRFVGVGVYSVALAAYPTVLAESGLNYMTFGLQQSSTAGLTKQQGSAVLVSGNSIAFTASIPMTGW